MDNLKIILDGVPEDVVDATLPSPYLRDYYRDEADRIFWIDSEINAALLDLVKMIIRCNREDKGIPREERKPIKVFIDSPGGDVCALWTTINAIDVSKTPVYTINCCTAFSAAFDLLAAGHKRFALKGTSGMTHSGSCVYGGTVEQAESMKKHFDKLGKKINDYVLAHTKIDPKMFKKKAPTDWYFDENDMLEYGIIDEIVEDFDSIF